MDKPFLENAPRHFLQDRDPPRVVFNEVVVGGYRVCDVSLLVNQRNTKFKMKQFVEAEVRLRRSA